MVRMDSTLLHLTMRMYRSKLIMMNMSDTVRDAIEKCGMTRYAIAQRTGISEGALSRFMSGDRDMTLRTLERFAHIIGVRLVVSRPKMRRKKGR